MTANNPSPATCPNFEHRYTTVYIMGKMAGTLQRRDGPREAPAAAYVPIAAGSSSDAPVIRPSPIDRNRPCGIGLLSPFESLYSRSGSCLRRSIGGVDCRAMCDRRKQKSQYFGQHALE